MHSLIAHIQSAKVKADRIKHHLDIRLYAFSKQSHALHFLRGKTRIESSSGGLRMSAVGRHINTSRGFVLTKPLGKGTGKRSHIDHRHTLSPGNRLHHFHIVENRIVALRSEVMLSAPCYVPRLVEIAPDNGRDENRRCPLAARFVDIEFKIAAIGCPWSCSTIIVAVNAALFLVVVGKLNQDIVAGPDILHHMLP